MFMILMKIITQNHVLSSYARFVTYSNIQFIEPIFLILRLKNFNGTFNIFISIKYFWKA